MTRDCFHYRSRLYCFLRRCTLSSQTRDRERIGRWIALSILLLPLAAAKTDQDFVRRKTDAADSDLISELLALGMIETAARIGEQRLSESQSDADAKAKWIMESTRIKIAAMLRDVPEAAPQRREQAAGEIDRFLTDYPDHPRALWLQFQRESIEIADNHRAVLMAIVKPSDDPARDEVTKRIIRASSRLQELSKAIDDQLAIERSKSPESIRASELGSLALAVANRRIELAMLRGDLFEEGSDDFVASANESLAASRGLLDSLPPGADGRDELVKQFAESLRRTGELEQAAAILSQLLETNPGDDAARALAVKVAIDLNDLPRAETLLQNNEAASVSSTLELDLARLQFAVARAKNAAAAPSQREIGDWIQRIGMRHGDYARRRAEQWVLSSSTGSSSSELDPRIVIAHAAGQVREGKSQQAGEWLASAAHRTRDPAAAFQLATAGAAAFRQADQFPSAARLLREVALAHFEHAEAAKLHLQAAILLADKASPDSIIEHLQECLATWPQDAVTMSAADWLVRLHEARGELDAAARVASGGDRAWFSAQWVERTGQLWTRAILAVPVSERELLAKQATDLLDREGVRERSESVVAKLRILFSDPGQMTSATGQSVEGTWLHWLYRIRQGQTAVETPDLEAVERSLRIAAADRLISDGEASKLNRAALASAILLLVGPEPSLQSAQAFGWKQDWSRCESILTELQQNHPQDLGLARSAARLLSSGDSESAKRAGLRRWTLLSAQLEQGSDQWHAAKLAAIKVMQSLGDHDEASRLASYVLLTQPPTDPAVKAQYQAVAAE